MIRRSLDTEEESLREGNSRGRDHGIQTIRMQSTGELSKVLIVISMVERS